MSDVMQSFVPREPRTTRPESSLSASAIDLMGEKKSVPGPLSSTEKHDFSMPVIDNIGAKLGDIYSHHPYLSTAALLALPPLLRPGTRMAIREGVEYVSGRLSFTGTEAIASLTNAPYKLRVYEWNNPAVLTGVARDSRTGEILASARNAIARVTAIDSTYGESNVNSLATAFAVSNDGRFMTNYHVIKDFPTCKLIDKRGLEYTATVLLRDQQNDLAVLQLDNKLAYSAFKPLKLAGGLPSGYSSEKSLLAFGHSNGCRNLHMSKSGRVDIEWPGTEAERQRGHTVVPLTIRPGNSGSPIIDKQTGLVVGVARAIPGEKEFNFRLSVVVPAEKARDLLKESWR